MKVKLIKLNEVGWVRNKKYKVDQNFAESALPARGIDIFVKLLMKPFASIRFSSLLPFAVALKVLHDVQLQGSFNRFNNFERNLSAGPSFMPRILIKCSSVSICRPSPSMLCSRKFCEWEKEENFYKNFKCEVTDSHPRAQRASSRILH
jgi:hypothetical protein